MRRKVRKAVKKTVEKTVSKGVLESFKIISVERVPGYTLKRSWSLDQEVIQTDKGEFISDPRQNDFSEVVGKTVKAYVNESSGFKWLSFSLKKLKGRLAYN